MQTKLAGKEEGGELDEVRRIIQSGIDSPALRILLSKAHLHSMIRQVSRVTSGFISFDIVSFEFGDETKGNK